MTEEQIRNYNRLMSIYEVQHAYQAATYNRKPNDRNLQRAIRLQDMAMSALGATGDFLSKPLPKVTRSEEAFLRVFITTAVAQGMEVGH